MMRFAFIIFFLFALNKVESAELKDVLNVATMLAPKKDLISCYQCKNISIAACNNIKSNETRFVKQCEENATGCNKRLFIVDGNTIMERDCYTGKQPFFKDFKCNDNLYDDQKCYICKDNLCNSSISMYALGQNSIIVMLSTVCIAFAVTNAFQRHE
uniref:Protein sleepless n=1 Tax=Stomoxys calcitrans TaxID=35570 RepID=A0A1I8QBJ9_STOCA